jgi:hypothetical protein
MKKIIVLLLVSGFFTIPISCVEEEQVYSIQQLGLRAGRVLKVAEAYVEQITFESTTDTISSVDFGIEIFVEEYELISESLRLGNPFISSAYAPPVIPKEVDDELALLKITSSDTLFISGTYYAPGTLLTNLFHVESGNSNPPKTIFKYMEESTEWEHSESIVLALVDTLDAPIQQTFFIQVTLEDASVFELETPVVRIK